MNENERDTQSRDGETGKNEQLNDQGQASTGQTESDQRNPEGLSQPSHQQGVDGGSVTAAGGGSNGPGAGSAGLDRDQQQSSQGGFVGSQGEESGEYLQQDQPNQGGFAEDGQGAPEGSEPGNIEGNRERDQNRESDIEGSSNS